MKLRDDDLRRALAPLAGDPAADAARVLTALLDEPPPQRPRSTRPPWPWLLLTLAAAAAGLLLGMLLRGEPAQQQQPAEPPQQQQPPPPPPPPEPPPEPPPLATLIAHLGPVDRLTGTGLDEQREELLAGAPLLPEATFATRETTQAVLRLRDGTKLHVDAATRLRLTAPDRIELVAGRILVGARSEPPATLTVHAEPGEVRIEGADAEVSFERATLSVYSFGPRVLLRNQEGLERLVRPHNRAWIVDGMLRDGRYTVGPSQTRAWTLPLLAITGEQSEIDRVVEEEIISVAVEMRMADVAFRPLHLLGQRALPAVFAYLQRTSGATDEVRAGIAGATILLASRQHLPALFELLADQDPAVRAVAHYAIIEVAGGMEYDDKFWREAPPEQRAERLAEWRKRVLGG